MSQGARLREQGVKRKRGNVPIMGSPRGLSCGTHLVGGAPVLDGRAQGMVRQEGRGGPSAA